MTAETTERGSDGQKRPRRRYHSPRRARQAAETRTAILATASQLFGERGWTRTTLAEIARNAQTAV
ncbi:MAG TPA: TetR family transcriptional regulator, partial [Acidimicrobiales bacterium]